MKNNIIGCIVLSLLVWAICLSIGFEFSKRRPLWNDEIYTQINSIEKVSYRDILKGKSPEGNNCPLFYIIQKSFCDGMQYRPAIVWNKEWYIHDKQSQIILRVVSNVFMATAIAGMFYFLIYYYSLALGFLSFIATLSIPMTWNYWIEARPYALWFFLTTAQSIILFLLIQNKERFSKGWIYLGVVHILLSLTISLGAAQVVIASVFFWIFKYRRWECHIFLTLIPLAISGGYYWGAPKYQFFFNETQLQLFLQAVPIEYGAILVMYLTSFFLFKRNKFSNSFQGGRYFLFMSSMILVAIAMLGLLKWKEMPGVSGFGISSRYFIFLVPTVVIAITVCIWDWWMFFKNNSWMRLNICIVIGGIFVLRLLKTTIAVMSSGIFMYFN